MILSTLSTVPPSGIFLPGTELLQSPFGAEFSMGSRSRRYRRSLRRHRRFLWSYRQFLRSYRDLWGNRRATLIVARLAKHHKTLLNILKHHETHVKHREPLVKHHETLKTFWNILKHSSFDAISALDAETSALDVETSAFGAATSAIARRSFDATISALDAETSMRRRWRGDVVARCGDVGARRSDVGDRAELPAISARSFQRYQRLRSWYNSADM